MDKKPLISAPISDVKEGQEYLIGIYTGRGTMVAAAFTAFKRNNTANKYILNYQLN